MIWAIVNIYYDTGLLPYYLRYYSERGVDRFVAICHNCTFPILTEYPCEVISLTEPFVHGSRDSALNNEYCKIYLKSDDWYLPTDLDEFHWNPGLKSFKEWISPDYEWVPSVFIDRVSSTGSLPVIDLNRTLDDQFPIQARISERLQCCCHHKCAMARSDVDASTGHHNAHPWKPAPFSVQTHHFKWVDGTLTWMSKRAPGADGIKRLLSHYNFNGKLNVGDSYLEGRPSPKIGV